MQPPFRPVRAAAPGPVACRGRISPIHTAAHASMKIPSPRMTAAKPSTTAVGALARSAARSRRSRLRSMLSTSAEASVRVWSRVVRSAPGSPAAARALPRSSLATVTNVTQPIAIASPAPKKRATMMIPDASPAYTARTERSPAADGCEKVTPTPTPRIAVGHQSEP